MLKEMEKISGKQFTEGHPADDILLELCYDDFRQLDDGSWITVREINIYGHSGKQRLIHAGREFKKGELFIIGVDLAAILEKFHN
ncbi:MAG: hypothetical protein HQ475_03310 [SAR202 cluster bacterium]|nr:hypothetical protein [SAR202 cluster bacterium]